MAPLDDLIISRDGTRWLEALFDLQLRRPLSSSTIDQFLSLDICRKEGGRIVPTSFGLKCADSAREYIFWIRRGRKFHGEDELDCLRLRNFCGMDLLEIGAGSGCNLASLSRVTKSAIGLEIDPLYIEFSRVLAKREKTKAPQMVMGRGECLPFPTSSFDWVLLWSVLQYMEIDRTLAECRRVLRRNGRVLVSVPLFSHGVNLGWNIRSIVRTAATALNTAAYQTFHRRLRKTPHTNSTASPVAITRRYLVARAIRSGLSLRSELSVLTSDRYLAVFQKL